MAKTISSALDPLQAMLRYRELQGVEQLFRSAKSLLATRTIFHKRDATIRGHRPGLIGPAHRRLAHPSSRLYCWSHPYNGREVKA